MNAPTSLIPLVEANPVMVLVDAEKFDRFYEEIAREVSQHVPDLDSATGRKAIASLAYKVARTKTAIDEAGKKLTEDKRSEIKAVDEARRVIRDKLDGLRDTAREPLTKWEAVEEGRAAAARIILDDIKDHARVSLIDTSHSVAERLDKLRAWDLTEDQFKESLPIANAARANAIDALTAAHARLIKEEEDKVELGRLRAAEEKRLAKDAIDKAEADRKAQEAEAAAKAAAAAEQAKAEEEKRVAAAAKAAEDAANAAAAEARRAQEAAHAEALAAEKRRADQAEAAQRAEADRLAKIEADRQADAKREADAQTAREANRAHRGKIMLAAKSAIMGHGVGETTAKAIVLAIAAGEIPNVTIKF